jgi:hypothetical protein
METVIVGYLVAFLAGAGRRFADKRIDGLLESLYHRVKKGLGGDPAIKTLAHEYKDPWAQENAKDAIAQATRQDPTLARDLTRLVRELDGRGARNLMVYAPQSETVIGVNKGVFVRDGYVYIDRSTHETHGGDPADLRGDAVWIKICFTIGLLLAIAGLGLFGYSFFGSTATPGEIGSVGPPEGIGRAAGVFFAGVILLGLAQIGHSISGPSRSSQRRAR